MVGARGSAALDFVAQRQALARPDNLYPRLGDQTFEGVDSFVLLAIPLIVLPLVAPPLLK